MPVPSTPWEVALEQGCVDRFLYSRRPGCSRHTQAICLNKWNTGWWNFRSERWEKLFFIYSKQVNFFSKKQGKWGKSGARREAGELESTDLIKPNSCSRGTCSWNKEQVGSWGVGTSDNFLLIIYGFYTNKHAYTPTHISICTHIYCVLSNSPSILPFFPLCPLWSSLFP